MIAFLVAGTALDSGRPTAMFLTKDVSTSPFQARPSASRARAARQSSASSNSTPSAAANLACPFCLDARGLEGAELVANARVAAPPRSGRDRSRERDRLQRR